MNCTTEEAFISGYSTFINELEKEHETWTKDQWTNNDVHFKKYTESCYPKFKAEMSVKERIAFWKNTMTYLVYRESSEIQSDIELNFDLDKEFEELSIQGRQEIEEFIKNELPSDLNATIDQILEDAESIGESIKEWLNN